MEQFLRQLQTIPEAAELIRRVEEGGCPAAMFLKAISRWKFTLMSI